MPKLYLLKTKYEKAISYHFKPPYDEYNRNIGLFQIMVLDSNDSESVSADTTEIPKEWKPFHGKFEKYIHLYDLVGKTAGNTLETLSVLGELNEPLKTSFDCSEVWEKGRLISSNKELESTRKHYYSIVGMKED